MCLLVRCRLRCDWRDSWFWECLVLVGISFHRISFRWLFRCLFSMFLVLWDHWICCKRVLVIFWREFKNFFKLFYRHRLTLLVPFWSRSISCKTQLDSCKWSSTCFVAFQCLSCHSGLLRHVKQRSHLCTSPSIHDEQWGD